MKLYIPVFRWAVRRSECSRGGWKGLERGREDSGTASSSPDWAALSET